MTIDTISNEFNLIQLDETNRIVTEMKTPVKSLDKASSPDTPETVLSSELSFSSCNSSVSSYDAPESSTFQREEVQVSEHKLAQLAGRHAEEPLLKENPHRYVLFPIQDADVSEVPYTFLTCMIPSSTYR